MNFMKPYITEGRFEIEEVLPFLTDNKRYKKLYKNNGKEYFVKMNSLRYKVFAKSLKCAKCPNTGSYFLLQRYKTESVFHFNLYAEDILNINNGELILMTKDHIIPKSKGGRDFISNMQTMCCFCNTLKGSE